MKKLVYAFIDDLENVKENEINANFIGELKEYLNVGIPQHKMTKSFLYCEAKNESKKLTERKVGK